MKNAQKVQQHVPLENATKIKAPENAKKHVKESATENAINMQKNKTNETTKICDAKPQKTQKFKLLEIRKVKQVQQRRKLSIHTFIIY